MDLDLLFTILFQFLCEHVILVASKINYANPKCFPKSMFTGIDTWVMVSVFVRVTIVALMYIDS